MRKPNLKDTFLASRIIKKLDLKNAQINWKANQEDLGKEVIFYIIENIDKVEDEISQLIANIFGVEKEQVLQMPLDEMYHQIKQIEGMSDFFQSLAKLTK